AWEPWLLGKGGDRRRRVKVDERNRARRLAYDEVLRADVPMDDVLRVYSRDDFGHADRQLEEGIDLERSTVQGFGQASKPGPLDHQSGFALDGREVERLGYPAYVEAAKDVVLVPEPLGGAVCPCARGLFDDDRPIIGGPARHEDR